jgi:hypothetical protein
VETSDPGKRVYICLRPGRRGNTNSTTQILFRSAGRGKSNGDVL